MEQVASQISIKGIREGLLVTVPDRGSLVDLLALLRVELAQKQAFLQGSRTIVSSHHPRWGAAPLLLQLQGMQNLTVSRGPIWQVGPTTWSWGH